LPEAENDLALLTEAARAAGEVALGMAGPALRHWDKPGGAGPVSAGDLAVNDLLEDRLRGARPDYGWLSEESPDDPARLGRERAFIVDPIDGTRCYIDGNKSWAHALAITRGGEVETAVIYLPRLDLLYHASRGGGAFLNGRPISPSPQSDLEHAEILAARRVMEPGNWRGGQVPHFRRAHRPSLAWRMALVAEGRFDAMLSVRPAWEWDIAAGDLILREAGALCTDRRGHGLRFNNPVPQTDGVVAGAAALHGQIRTALRES